MTATLERPQPAAPPPGEPAKQAGGNAMRRVALRSLIAHKMRFLLTLVSVVLGTAFVAGSFVLTNALGSSITDIVGGSLKETDVVVSPSEGSTTGLPLTLVDTIRGVDGVDAVEPAVGDSISLIDSTGKAVTTSGAPIQGGSWTEGADNATITATITEGHAPRGNNEVVINEAGLEKAGLKVGDKTKVLLPEHGPTEITVVGSYKVDFATGAWIGVFFAPDQARQYFLKGNEAAEIYVRGDSITQEELKSRVDAVLPATATTQTGEAYLDVMAEQVQSAMSFVNTFLLVFGIIGIGVGASLIYITFSMVIAQRLRELALLRAIGASRGQIMRSVLAEGILVGVVGSAIGVLLGWAIAYGMLQLMGNSMGLPVGDVAMTWQAVAWAVGLGVFITLVSSVAPALRAGNTAPVEAMRGLHATPKTGKARWIIGSLIFLAGIGLTALGVAQSTLWMLGAGFALVLVGLVFLSAYIAPRVFSLFRPITRRTPVGRLAHGNTIRNPKRTAATAFALAIGMALVTAFSLIGASAKSTFTDVLTHGQKWTYAISSSQSSIPPVVLTALEETPGVKDAVSMGWATIPQKGEERGLDVTAIRGDVSTVMDTAMEEGSSTLGPGSIMVSRDTAESKGWKLGDTIQVERPNMTPLPLKITGIMKNNGLLQPAAVSSEDTDKFTPENQRVTFTMYTTLEPNADPTTVRAALNEVVKDYPMTRVMDQDEVVEQNTAQINTMLAVLYGLLGLALVISILGIVNTLALAVVERTREVGMMRAIGASRGQIRRMITGESVLICTYGALLGLVIGLVYGWLFMGQLADDGLTSRVIPWSNTVGFLIAAVVVGLIAAIWPAMKAARTRPLEAITEG